MLKHYFTFGQNHMASYPLPSGGGRLSDYYVTVELPFGYELTHREVFLQQFTELYCPDPMQFSMEYEAPRWKPEYFPGGQLCCLRPREAGHTYTISDGSAIQGA